MHNQHECRDFSKAKDALALFALTSVVCVALASSFVPLALAQTKSQTAIQSNSYQIYHDADELVIEPKTGNISAKGRALFLLGDVFLSADRVVVLRDKNLATAEGDVRLIRSGEDISASRMVYDLATHEMRVTDARFLVDPKLKGKAVIETNVLNLTEAELAFESARTARQDDLKIELKQLREEFVALRNLKRLRRNIAKNDADEKIERVKIRYTQTLERLQRTRWQPNVELNALPQETRKRLTERREAVNEIVKSNPDIQARYRQPLKMPGYFAMSADEAVQRKDGTYELKNATVTSCRCENDDSPAFGFSAHTAKIEVEEYATLYGTTINVLDTPIFYTPYLKFPIKTKRQTGLLIPSVYRSSAGDVYSLPLFVTLGPTADTTITATHFQNRGPRAEVEARFALRNDSRMRAYYETIEDVKVEGDAEELRQEKQKAIDEKTDRIDKQKAQEDLDLQMEKVRKRRWFAAGSWNVPAYNMFSLKMNGELASDNTYLSDYSREAGSTQDLFSPSVSARRFLTQEVATEYYGTDAVMSVRVQEVQDLLIADNSTIEKRLPRVEFHLLPRRYNDLPVIFDQTLHWERVVRKDNKKFLDKDYTVDVFDSVGTTQKVNMRADGRKDVIEPYQMGDRLYSETLATLPLPQNDYVNASIGIRGTAVQYYFPAVDPFDKVSPYQSYVNYEASLNVPLFSQFKTRETAREGGGYVRHDFVPYVGLSYIPSIERHAAFPASRGDLFYVADFVNPQQTVNFGFTSDWAIVRESYKEVEKSADRLAKEYDFGVANEKFFEDVLASRKISIESPPEELLAFVSTQNARDIFGSWATKELETYENQVAAQDFGDYYVWPASTVYKRAEQWRVRPFSLSVSSGYNFLAKKTEKEMNARKRPGELPDEVDPLQDVNANLQSQLTPFAPVTLNVYGSWSRKWKRLTNAGVSGSVGLPLGFSVSASNSYITRTGDERTGVFWLDRTIRAGLGYSPPFWSKVTAEVQYEHQYNLPAQSDAERELEKPHLRELSYRSLQRISFLKLQDCIDLVFQRYKDRNVIEKNAIWSVGINMTIGPVIRPLPEISRTVSEMKRAFERETAPLY